MYSGFSGYIRASADAFQNTRTHDNNRLSFERYFHSTSTKMAHRRTLAGITPSRANIMASSPLRRKSLAAEKITPIPFSQNDDEAEILARRREQGMRQSILLQNETSENNNTSERRQSLGMLAQLSKAELTEEYNQCIKLSAENKINVKNAFRLQLIDFMLLMLKKQDPNMNNLQVASTTLDASAKIYGFRVDCVHSSALKMAGGLAKQDTNTENSENEPNNTEGEVLKQPEKPKKKQSQPKILSTTESLQGTIDIRNLSSTTSNDDTQTTDLLCLVSLRLHANNGYAMHLFNDVLMDSTEENHVTHESQLQGVLFEPICHVEELTMTPAISNFYFLGWSEEDVSQLRNPDLSSIETQQFDIDEMIDDNNDNEQVGINYFDLDDVSQENVNRCAREPVSFENIVDFRISVSDVNNKVCEYSYVQKNLALHWAGPIHWKPKSFGFTKNIDKVVETCRQEARRKRKDITLEYTDDILNVIAEKFSYGQPRRLLSKTLRQAWHEDKITLPEDVHYNINATRTYYYHTGLNVQMSDGQNINTTVLDNEINNYNYGNENDTQNYCPDVQPDDDHNNESPLPDEDIENHSQNGIQDSQPMTQAFTGDNLVMAPKQTNKLHINYASHAKKIDMRRLKLAVWKSLTRNSIEESGKFQTPINGRTSLISQTVHDTQFNKIYKNLPTMLDKQSINALSPALAFVSLLHLANEKSLFLESTEDKSDLHIMQG